MSGELKEEQAQQEFDSLRQKRRDRIPPMIVCPYCQPGMISYAGVVVSRVCKQCKEALERSR